MGYYQTGNWSLSIPHTADANEILTVLSDTFTSNDFYLEDDEPNTVLYGSSDSKYYDDQDEVILDLAKQGVKGFIDFRGEDGELWRVRLVNRKVINTPGQIVYDGDDDEQSS